MSFFERLLFPSLGKIEGSTKNLEKNMSRVTETLIAINDQLNKAAGEIISKIEELKSRDYLTNEDKNILDNILVGAQTLDDIVPDEVVEEAEEEQDAEQEEDVPAVEEDETDSETVVDEEDETDPFDEEEDVDKEA